MDWVVFAVETAKIRYRESIYSFLNPINWIIFIPAQIIRIPFLILEKAGLPKEIEENILSQIFKVFLLFLLILTSMKIPFIKNEDLLSILLSVIK
jgi:hypothetical protein